MKQTNGSHLSSTNKKCIQGSRVTSFISMYHYLRRFQLKKEVESLFYSERDKREKKKRKLDSAMTQVKGCTCVGDNYLLATAVAIIDLFYTRITLNEREINLARAGYKGVYA